MAVTRSSVTLTRFDSASLSGSAIVAHAVPSAGEYELDVVVGEGRLALVARLHVHGTGPTSVAIDAAGPMPHDLSLGTGGFVRLSAAGGRGGVRARLRHGENGAVAWDSERLEAGDLFACLPLRPGRYQLANRLATQATALVTVPYPDPRTVTHGHRRPLGPVFVDAAERFTPDAVSVVVGEPLVVRIRDAAHVTLDLVTADDGPDDLGAWREQREREVLDAFVARTSRRGVARAEPRDAGGARPGPSDW